MRFSVRISKERKCIKKSEYVYSTYGLKWRLPGLCLCYALESLVAAVASMSSSAEVAVFTDTSMGTHIAIAVSPNITAGDFKRKLESEHLNCFPGLGKIRVNGLTVKQKSCFYHLPESVSIKHFFQGLEGNWFLHAEASSLCTSDNPVDKKRTDYPSKKKKRIEGKQSIECAVPEFEKGCLGGNEESAAVTNREKFGFFWPNYEVETKEERNSIPETGSESSSEVISVTGIINRYFTDFKEVSPSGDPLNSEVTSGVVHKRIGHLNAKKGDTRLQVEAMRQFTAITPQNMLPCRLMQSKTSARSSDKHNGAAVWKRLLLASNNLGIPCSKQRPLISVCRFKDGKMSGRLSYSPIRSLVFEIGDTED